MHVSEQLDHQVSIPKELDSTEIPLCPICSQPEKKSSSCHSSELPTKSKEEVLDLLRNFDRKDKEDCFTCLRHMMKTDQHIMKINEQDTIIKFLTNLKQRKHHDVNLLTKQIEVITRDLETSMAKKTALGAVSSDELPGTTTNVQEVAEQCPSLISAAQGEVSAIQKQNIEYFFDEIAENYIRARVPVLSDPQGSLEEWGRLLNGLTQLKKFRELGTLMYAHPAQGPSIVSSIDFDNDGEFFAVGGVRRSV